MAWVERDGEGKIVAAYSSSVAGKAEEQLRKDDPELVAFQTDPPAPPLADRVEQLIARDPVLSAIVRSQAKVEGISEREKLDAIRLEVR